MDTGTPKKASTNNSFSGSIGRYDQQRAGLATSQRFRRQTEKDAQLLANRINLLRNEEIKARKRIQATEKRVMDIEKARSRNQQKAQLKANIEAQKKRDELRLREHVQINRLDREELMEEKQQDRLLKKRSNVRHQRNVSVETATAIAKQQQQRIVDNMKVVHHMRMASRGGQMAISEYKKKRIDHFRHSYNGRIESEDKNKQLIEKEVQAMELMEMELIKQLQHTQLRQKQAYDALETTLRSPRKFPAPPGTAK